LGPPGNPLGSALPPSLRPNLAVQTGIQPPPIATSTQQASAPVQPPRGIQPPAPQAQAPVQPAVQPPQGIQPSPQPAPTFQPPEIDPQIQALRQQFTGLRTPSAEERRINEELSNLLTGVEQGQERIRTQPIATPFLRGQAAALERQVGLKASPLQRQLAMLQAERMGAREALSEELGFAERDIDRTQGLRERFETQQEQLRNQVFGIAESLSQKGATEEQIQSVLNATTPEEALRAATATGLMTPQEAQGFTLSPGQVRFDAQGRRIAGVAPMATAGTGAGMGGVGAPGQTVRAEDLTPEQLGRLSGAARSVLQNPQGFRNMTPTMQGQILDELGREGIDTSPLFPDPGMANMARAAFTAVRDGETALNMINNSNLFFRNDRPQEGTIQATRRIVASRIPGTDTYEISRAIQSLKDNIGIDSLLNIKREGSGLGQVPQRQLETLQGLLGRLEVGRSPALLRRDLEQAVKLYQNILDQAGQDIVSLMRPEQTQQTAYVAPDGTRYVQGPDGLFYQQ
jgi:hypothetical protein